MGVASICIHGCAGWVGCTEVRGRCVDVGFAACCIVSTCYLYLSSCYILSGKSVAFDEAQIRVPLIQATVLILATIVNGCKEITSELTR